LEVYGADPADVGNDEFIDAVDGRCGKPAGMTVDDFERSMEASQNRETHG